MAKKRKGYLQGSHTKDRRFYIDYDKQYINSLNEEELEWLSRFTDEEYGASFELNPVFVKFKDLSPIFQEIVKDNILHEGKYVQVYKNKKGQKNLDMRKMRPYKQFYLDENGKFTDNRKYRYSDSNLSDPFIANERQRLNNRVSAMRDDLMCSGLKETISMQPDVFNNTNNNRKNTEHHTIEDHLYELSREDVMILEEEFAILNDIDSKSKD